MMRVCTQIDFACSTLLNTLFMTFVHSAESAIQTIIIVMTVPFSQCIDMKLDNHKNQNNHAIFVLVHIHASIYVHA